MSLRPLLVAASMLAWLPAQPPPAAADPRQRQRLGEELLVAGELDAAAAELVWCFDHGHRLDRSYYEVRFGSLVADLAALGSVHPHTHAEFTSRLERAEQLILQGSLDHESVLLLVALGDIVGASERPVRTFELLVARGLRGEPMQTFFAQVRPRLWQQHRYATILAVAGNVERRIRQRIDNLREAARRLAGTRWVPDPTLRWRIVGEAGIYVEALFGEGHDAAAARLVDLLVAFEPSVVCLARLVAHVERSGAVGAAAALRRGIETSLDGSRLELLQDILRRPREQVFRLTATPSPGDDPPVR